MWKGTYRYIYEEIIIYDWVGRILDSHHLKKAPHLDFVRKLYPPPPYPLRHGSNKNTIMLHNIFYSILNFDEKITYFLNFGQNNRCL